MTPPRRPRNLHVTHSWGGGVTGWVEDFCRFDPHSENFVFESVSVPECYGLSFRLHGGSARPTDRTWTLQRPITEVATVHPEYAALLGSVVEELGIDHVLVSSVVGHSLDAYATKRPTTLVYHDYFPFCPALNVYFEGVCASCGRGELLRCLRENPLSHLFRRHSPEYWTGVRDAFFEHASGVATHVSPSRSLVENLLRLDPRFEELRFAIVPHGIPFPKRDCFGGAEEGRRLRLLILGHLLPQKGLHLLRRVFPYLRAVGDLSLVGSSDPGSEFAHRFGVTVIRSFDHDDLPHILDSVRPDLALLFSVVPESFSLALSELQAHSIPALARTIGSFPERIVSGETGFLVGESDTDLVDEVLRLEADRAALRAVAANLRECPVRSVREQVDDYYRLRKDDSGPLGS